MFSYWLLFFLVETTICSAQPDNVSGGEPEIEVGGPLLGQRGLFVASLRRQILKPNMLLLCPSGDIKDLSFKTQVISPKTSASGRG